MMNKPIAKTDILIVENYHPSASEFFLVGGFIDTIYVVIINVQIRREILYLCNFVSHRPTLGLLVTKSNKSLAKLKRSSLSPQ